MKRGVKPGSRLPRGANYLRRVQRAERRMKVARLFAKYAQQALATPIGDPRRQGVQKRIAQELGVSITTVSDDLKALELVWRAESVDYISAQKAAALARIDWLEAQARAEWERSKLNATDTEQRAEQTGLDTAGRPVMVKGQVRSLSRSRCGNPSYLEVLRGLEADRAKLLGYYAPERVEVTSVDVTKWRDDQLEAYQALRSAGVPVRDAIERVLAMTAPVPQLPPGANGSSTNGGGKVLH